MSVQDCKALCSSRTAINWGSSYLILKIDSLKWNSEQKKWVKHMESQTMTEVSQMRDFAIVNIIVYCKFRSKLAELSGVLLV